METIDNSFLYIDWTTKSRPSITSYSPTLKTRVGWLSIMVPSLSLPWILTKTVSPVLGRPRSIFPSTRTHFLMQPFLVTFRQMYLGSSSVSLSLSKGKDASSSTPPFSFLVLFPPGNVILVLAVGFYTWAMLKGPRISFFVVVLLLGVKSSSKNVPKVTKNVWEQNLLQSKQKMLQREKKVCKKRCFIINLAFF